MVHCVAREASLRRVVVFCGLFLAACTPEEAAEWRSSRGAAPPAAEAGEPAEMPPQAAGADTSWTTEAVIVERDNHALLYGVRAATHDGFDRIVFDFLGGDLPGYHIEYARAPITACGSGAEVEGLRGAARLSIRLTPAAAHDADGRVTVERRDLRFELPVLLGLTLTCDFEADVTWIGSLRTANPYRVFELSAPNRIVIDVRHRM